MRERDKQNSLNSNFRISPNLIGPTFPPVQTGFTGIGITGPTGPQGP
ncbi:exosporium leader peptide-containing protein, partial [Peribacillus sp. SIMBA_075]